MGDCHWGRYSNSATGTLLYSHCCHVFICLTLGYEHKDEYVRTLILACLLNHHPRFHAYPACRSPRSHVKPCSAVC